MCTSVQKANMLTQWWTLLTVCCENQHCCCIVACSPQHIFSIERIAKVLKMWPLNWMVLNELQLQTVNTAWTVKWLEQFRHSLCFGNVFMLQVVLGNHLLNMTVCMRVVVCNFIRALFGQRVFKVWTEGLNSTHKRSLYNRESLAEHTIKEARTALFCSARRFELAHREILQHRPPFSSSAYSWLSCLFSVITATCLSFSHWDSLQSQSSTYLPECCLVKSKVKNVSKRPTAVDFFMLYKHKMRAESLFNTRLFVKMSPPQDVAQVQISQISQIEHSRAECDAAANWNRKFVHSTKFSLFSFHFNSSLCLTFLMAKRCHHFLFYFTKKLFLTGLPR